MLCSGSLRFRTSHTACASLAGHVMPTARNTLSARALRVTGRPRPSNIERCAQTLSMRSIKSFWLPSHVADPAGCSISHRTSSTMHCMALSRRRNRS